MAKISPIKRSNLCAMCIALCCVLPIAFHALSLGHTFSPMHIPVLLCGMICGPAYGAFCGIAGPVLSSLLTSMPSVTGLISMVPELVAYGCVSGMLMKRVRTGKLSLDLYLSLVPAMLAGRVVGGIASALFYLGNSSAYSFELFVTSYFVTALPGIVLHLVVVPTLAVVLAKAGVIPTRYHKSTKE